MIMMNVFIHWFFIICYIALNLGDNIQCTKDTIDQVLNSATPSLSCSKEEIAQFPKFMKENIDFLSYALYPSNMDNFVRTQRKFADKEKYKLSTDVVSKTSVQYWIGTKDKGKTLLLFFVGTENMEDVKVDLNVKHDNVQLPGIVSDRLLYTNPEKTETVSPQEIKKLAEFRIHQGVHNKLTQKEPNKLIQEDLLYLYCGHQDIGPVPWTEWCTEHSISAKLQVKLIKYGFQQSIKDVKYTVPKAMHKKSKHWKQFIHDTDISKKEIVLVTEAVNKIKLIIKHGRKGIDTTKVENLIISGQSLGAGYATYFFLRMYGDGKTHDEPGYHVLPELNKVTLIAFNPPSIVYNKDVDKISDTVLSRITNILSYDDPIPIVMNGQSVIPHDNGVHLSLGSIWKFRKSKSLEKLGTNEPIGNIILMIKGNKHVQIDDKEKIGNREEVWLKIIPFNGEKGYYIKNGAKCLSDRTSMGIFGAMRDLMKHHFMPSYYKIIFASCLGNYLNTKSKYFRDIRKGSTIKKAYEKGLQNRKDMIKEIKYESKKKGSSGFFGKLFGSNKNSAYQMEEDDEYIGYDYYDDTVENGELELSNLFVGNMYYNYISAIFIVLGLCVVVAISFVLGSICGCVFAFKKE
eukprot:527105_1